MTDAQREKNVETQTGGRVTFVQRLVKLQGSPVAIVSLELRACPQLARTLGRLATRSTRADVGYFSETVGNAYENRIAHARTPAIPKDC